ncbi:MAG: peptidoglycan-binding domain-containing protein [Pseudorhodoplanes sp.]|uniref:peptidoglycan-binding domain-containing protein n=1 Tax=Pseudorhodoplanes sp. TaxID=1934341 RepID=UPI003D0B41BB
MASVSRLAVATVCSAIAGGTAAQAQTPLRLHDAVAVAQRPLLCPDRGSASLVFPVMTRAANARAERDPDKAQRLTEIATRLQGEICRKAADDDVVILRCKLGQADAGGAPLALVKVSAVIRSEAAKGEQPFYAVTNLQIEDATAGPTTQEANTRWCGDERAARRIEDAAGGTERKSEEPFDATADIVLRVQQRLFDFGLRTENLDGNLNQETVRNLVQFQKFAGLNADGRLTRPTIERLMTTPAPSPWVTIAFDGFGNFAAETGRTRRDTELMALERMQRRSSRDVKISSVAAPNCLGLAITRYTERGRRQRTNFTQAFTSGGDSADVAARNARDYCEREKGGGQCQVRYALCADGSGGNRAPDEGDRRRNRNDQQDEVRRHDRNSPPVNSPPPQQRFDPKDVTVNSQIGPKPRFDPDSLSINAPPSQERPSAPGQRFDPKDMPANSPNPNLR